MQGRGGQKPDEHTEREGFLLQTVKLKGTPNIDGGEADVQYV
jgi:hypothetical protein